MAIAANVAANELRDRAAASAALRYDCSAQDLREQQRTVREPADRPVPQLVSVALGQDHDVARLQLYAFVSRNPGGCLPFDQKMEQHQVVGVRRQKVRRGTGGG